jgi:hypothetical protein
MRAQSITTATTVDTGRRQINTSNFTTPTVKYACYGSQSGAGVAPRLVTNGVNETGVAGISAIGSSTLTFTGTGSTYQTQTASGLSITDGDRFMPDFTGTGTLSIGSCMMIIQLN